MIQIYSIPQKKPNMLPNVINDELIKVYQYCSANKLSINLYYKLYANNIKTKKKCFN